MRLHHDKPNYEFGALLLSYRPKIGGSGLESNQLRASLQHAALPFELPILINQQSGAGGENQTHIKQFTKLLPCQSATPA